MLSSRRRKTYGNEAKWKVGNSNIGQYTDVVSLFHSRMAILYVGDSGELGRMIMSYERLKRTFELTPSSSPVTCSILSLSRARLPERRS